MKSQEHIVVDTPAEGVSRITLNRPDSRNALNNVLRAEILGQLEANDLDDGVFRFLLTPKLIWFVSRV